MTGVLITGGRGSTRIQKHREGGPVKTEIGVRAATAKEHQVPPTAGRGKAVTCTCSRLDFGLLVSSR